MLDDDDVFREALSALFQDDGHTVRAYRSIAEMPPITELGTFAAVISDYHLSGGSEDGLSFAKRYHAIYSDVPIIMITAYSSGELEQAVAQAPYLSLMRKPIDYDELHQLLHDLS